MNDEPSYNRFVNAGCCAGLCLLVLFFLVELYSILFEVLRG